MSLSDRLAEMVRACSSALWIESHEHDDAVLEIKHLCRTQGWRLAVWDIERGLQVPGQETAGEAAGGGDPLAAIRSLNALAGEAPALLLLLNFHRSLGTAEIVQAVARQASTGKQNRTFVVILSPLVQVP